MIADTNAVSDFLAGDPKVRSVLRRSFELRLPVIVLGEYLFGIKSSRERRRLLSELREFVRDCTVLLIDEETAEHYADIREELRGAGTPIPEADLWIAALARQHDPEIASKDAHFDLVDGIRRIGW